jgi:RNA polymerase sigma-70 factor (ECF subfamily)
MQPEPAGTLARGADDASLVRRIADGDRSAFTLLMRTHNRRLYRLARASLGDPTEAEDAVQDAYLNAYRSIGSFRGESALGTWLSRLVLNECFARQRRRLRRENVIPMVSFESTIENVSGIPDEDQDPPDRLAGRAQIRAVLEAKVGALPEAFRTVFVLRSVEELSVEETAEILGLTEETVRSRHFRARGLLRESLAKDLDLAERDVFEFGGCHCDAMIARVLAKL